MAGSRTNKLPTCSEANSQKPSPSLSSIGPNDCDGHDGPVVRDIDFGGCDGQDGHAGCAGCNIDGDSAGDGDGGPVGRDSAAGGGGCSWTALVASSL